MGGWETATGYMASRPSAQPILAVALFSTNSFLCATTGDAPSPQRWQPAFPRPPGQSIRTDKILGNLGYENPRRVQALAALFGCFRRAEKPANLVFRLFG